VANAGPNKKSNTSKPTTQNTEKPTAQNTSNAHPKASEKKPTTLTSSAAYPTATSHSYGSHEQNATTSHNTSFKRAQFENALSDIPGRFYRYAVKASWADKYEEEQRQLDQLDADRADWLTLKQIAHEANLDYRTLIRQFQDNRALGAQLKTIDHYQMRGPGQPYKYHPHQAREAIAQYRKQPKYDLNRSANVLKTLKQVPNATVDELATKLRAKRGTIYATLRNLERKNLVTRTRAPCGPTTRPPDLWQAK